MARPPIFDNIPSELQRLPRWVTWRAEGPSDKKPRKVPYDPKLPNSRASSTDPETWGTFEQAHAAWSEGGRTGIGFVLNGDGIAGVDLDHCVDETGTPSALALEVITRLRAGYVEISPSGTGVRAFGYADGLQSGVSGKLNNLHVELYTTGRYLTLTGRTFKAEPLGPLYAFDELATRLRGSSGARSAAAATAPALGKLTDACPVQGARLAPTMPHGDELDRVLADLASALEFLSSDGYDNWYRCGLALKTLGPAGRELWMNWSRRWPQFDEDEASRKWESLKPERTSYQANFAAAQVEGWGNPGRTPRLRDGADLQSGLDVDACIAARAGEEVARRTVDESALVSLHGVGERDGGTAFAGHLLTPPGIVGQIAQWIQDTSPKPQPTLAVTAALVMVAAALANKVRFGASHTQLYCVNVANSGEGKDRPQACISEAFEASGASMAAKLPGSQLASGQALMTIGHREPTTVLVLDEFGDMLAKATSKTAAPFEREITTILKIQWSHAGRVMRGREYADQRARPRQDIQYPCMSMLGSSTPGRFYSSITPHEIEDGTLNRLLTVRAANYAGPPIPREPEPVPEAITGWLAAACEIKPIPLTAQSLGQPHQPRSVTCSPMAQAILAVFATEAEGNRHALLANPSRAQLAGWWVRAYENARRIALILAVGRHTDPETLHAEAHGDTLTIDPTSAQWAVDYVRSIVEDMLEQSEGRIGDSELERVVIAIEAALRKAGPLGLTMREARRKAAPFGRVFDPEMADKVWRSVAMRGARREAYPPSGGRGPSREALVHPDSIATAEAA